MTSTPQTGDEELRKPITLDDQLEHCLGSLVFIYKHTYSFENDPVKKARQLERNKEAFRKAKETLANIVESTLTTPLPLEQSEEGLDVLLNELADTASIYGENSARTVGKIKAIHANNKQREEEIALVERIDELDMIEPLRGKVIKAGVFIEKSHIDGGNHDNDIDWSMLSRRRDALRSRLATLQTNHKETTR